MRRRSGLGVAKRLARKELPEIRQRCIGGNAGQQKFPELTRSAREVHIAASGRASIKPVGG